jgi:hypothetical protein
MNKSIRFIRTNFAKVARDRRGAVSIVAAVSFAALVGFAGLGTEASFWYVHKRSLQGAADSGAFTAAAALMSGENATNFSNAAKAIAATYGYVNGTNGVSITVNNPPSTGPNRTNSSAVEILIAQPQPRLFSALFMSSAPNIIGRAVAMQGPKGSNGCVLALDKSSTQTGLKDSGNTTLNMQNCSLYVNSSDMANALWLNGNVTVNAYSTHVVGALQSNGGATLNDSMGTYQKMGTALPDPYANVQVPNFSGCDAGTSGGSVGAGLQINNGTSSSPIQLQPGVYCGGLDVEGGNVNLAPGVYYMNGGSGTGNNGGFTVNGNATLTGDGVTIILTGTSGHYATAQVNGTATVTLNATQPPALGGLAIFQDRNAPTYKSNDNTTQNKLNGTANLNINGAIYFPNQYVDFTGGANTGGAICTQLVAYVINFSGNTNFNSNCAGMDTSAFGATASVILVE